MDLFFPHLRNFQFPNSIECKIEEKSISIPCRILRRILSYIDLFHLTFIGLPVSRNFMRVGIERIQKDHEVDYIVKSKPETLVDEVQLSLHKATNFRFFEGTYFDDEDFPEGRELPIPYIPLPIYWNIIFSRDEDIEGIILLFLKQITSLIKKDRTIKDEEDDEDLGEVIQSVTENVFSRHKRLSQEYRFNPWNVPESLLEKLLANDGMIGDCSFEEIVLLWSCYDGNGKFIEKILNGEKSHQYLSDEKFRRDMALMCCCGGKVECLKLLLKFSKNFSLNFNDNLLFRSSCACGSVEVVKYLVEEHKEKIDVFSRNSEGFVKCCNNGHAEVCEFLLKNTSIDPTLNGSTGLKAAARNGHADVLRVLLEDSRIDPKKITIVTLNSACSEGKIEVLKVLFADGRIDFPTENYKRLVRRAVFNNKDDVVELLVSYKKEFEELIPNFKFQDVCSKGKLKEVKEMVETAKEKNFNVFADDAHGLGLAAENGHIEIVKFFVEYFGYDKIQVEFLTVALRKACGKGNLEIVKYLLSLGNRINPGTNYQSAIQESCRGGNVEIIKLLLEDERVDPSSSHNHPIQISCLYGKVEVVRALMEDKRVDPSDRNNLALQWAVSFSQVEIVELLLRDKRVNPADQNFKFVHSAVDRNNLKILKMLILHQKVDVYSINSEEEVFILAKRQCGFLEGLPPSKMEIQDRVERISFLFDRVDEFVKKEDMFRVLLKNMEIRSIPKVFF